MAVQYTNEEYTDMLLVFGYCQGNGRESVRVYSARFPNRRVPIVKILEEIIAVLVSKRLIGDLMRPQEAYDENCVRGIIDDVTQSSVMRLDPCSVAKLWDLITMVFKWQVAMTDNIIGLTLRHLYEIETHVTNPTTHQQLQKVQNLIENFDKIFDRDEKAALHEEVAKWLENYNVKVSLLLKMGLQDNNGRFLRDDLNSRATDMLRNLGENIYEVTQNGRILENTADANANPPAELSTVNEVEAFADELLGNRTQKNDSHANRNVFKLTISREIDSVYNINGEKVLFDNVEVDIDGDKFEDLMKDISLNEKQHLKTNL